MYEFYRESALHRYATDFICHSTVYTMLILMFSPFHKAENLHAFNTENTSGLSRWTTGIPAIG